MHVALRAHGIERGMLRPKLEPPVVFVERQGAAAIFAEFLDTDHEHHIGKRPNDAITACAMADELRRAGVLDIDDGKTGQADAPHDALAIIAPPREVPNRLRRSFSRRSRRP